MPRKKEKKTKTRKQGDRARQRRRKTKAKTAENAPWRQLPQLTQGQMPFSVRPGGDFRQSLSAPPMILNPLAPSGVFGGSAKPAEDADVEYIKTVLTQARKDPDVAIRKIKQEPMDVSYRDLPQAPNSRVVPSKSGEEIMNIKREMAYDLNQGRIENSPPMMSPILRRQSSMPELEDSTEFNYNNVEYSPFLQQPSQYQNNLNEGRLSSLLTDMREQWKGKY